MIECSMRRISFLNTLVDNGMREDDHMVNTIFVINTECIIESCFLLKII